MSIAKRPLSAEGYYQRAWHPKAGRNEDANADLEKSVATRSDVGSGDNGITPNDSTDPGHAQAMPA